MNFFLPVFLFLSFSLFSSDFSFDSINWKYNKKSSDMDLYVYSEESCNAYKVEKMITNFNAEKIAQNILDFENYQKIFPRQKKFDIVKKLNDNFFLIYGIIDFFPIKNRDYYVLFNYREIEDDEKKIYLITWYPATNEYKEYYEAKTKENERAYFINGRWKIVDYKNGEVYISAEIHNDWRINVSKSVLEGFEKQNAFDMLANVLNYTKATK